jgi:hypothetical protein
VRRGRRDETKQPSVRRFSRADFCLLVLTPLAAGCGTISGDTLRAATGDGSEVGEPLTWVRITDGSPAPFRVRKR